MVNSTVRFQFHEFSNDMLVIFHVMRDLRKSLLRDLPMISFIFRHSLISFSFFFLCDRLNFMFPPFYQFYASVLSFSFPRTDCKRLVVRFLCIGLTIFARYAPYFPYKSVNQGLHFHSVAAIFSTTSAHPLQIFQFPCTFVITVAWHLRRVCVCILFLSIFRPLWFESLHELDADGHK